MVPTKVVCELSQDGFGGCHQVIHAATSHPIGKMGVLASVDLGAHMLSTYLVSDSLTEIQVPTV